MQKQQTQKFTIITVLLIALLALPLLSHAENGKGLSTIPETGQKTNEAKGVEAPKYSDENIEAYLSTLEERGKIENPVTKHFVVVRAVAVMGVLFGGVVYYFVRFRKINFRR